MSRFTRRTFLGASLVGATALTAGCGRPAQSDSGQESSNEPEPISDGKATGTLTVWTMSNYFEDVIAGFKKENPDVTVNVTQLPWQRAHDKFTAAIAAGTAPDVAQVGTTWMGEFASLDALEVTPTEIDLSKYFEGSVASLTVAEKKYGIPLYTDTRSVFYRKDLAEKAGYSEVPSGWADFQEFIEAIQNKAGAKWGIMLPPGGKSSYQRVLPFAWSNGGRLLDEDGSAYTFDAPEVVEAIEYYQSYFDGGLADKTPSLEALQQNFVSGKVPVFLSGAYDMANIEDLGGAGFADKYGIALIPSDQESRSFLGGANACVFRSTKNRDAAWKLIEYLGRPETQVNWYSHSKELPAATQSWQDPLLADNTKLRVFNKQLESAVPPPPLPTWNQVASVFDSTMAQVCRESLDPAKAMANVQAEAEAVGTGLE